MRMKKNIFSILFFKLASLSLLLSLFILSLSSFPASSYAAETEVNQTEVLEAYNLIYRAENDMNNLNYNNLPSQQVYDLLYLAKNSYNNKLYNDSISYSKQATGLSIEIFELSDRIKNLKKILPAFYELTQDNGLENEILAAENEFSVSNIDGAKSILANIETNISKSLRIRYEEYSGYAPDLKALVSDSFNQSIIDAYYDETFKKIETPDYGGALDLLIGWDYLNSTANLINAVSEYHKLLVINNINTKRFTDESDEAHIYFDIHDFRNSYLALNRSKSTFIIAIESKAQIEKTKNQIDRIAKRGIDVSAQNDSLKKAYAEFGKENFEDALSISKKAYDETSTIEQNALIFGAITQSELRDSIFGFIKRNIIFILIIILSGVVLVFFMINYVSYTLSSKKKQDMIIELETLDELLKQAQWDFYDKKIIDKKNYEISIKQNQTRKIEVNNNIQVIDDKIQRRKAILKKWFRLKLDEKKNFVDKK